MNSRSLLLLSLTFFVLFACEKEQAFDGVNELETGAYARLLNQEGGFFLTDIAQSVVETEVEFYDENEGADVASYSWTVKYFDGSGDIVGPVAILNIDAAAFSRSDAGLPAANFSISFEEVIQALALDVDDIAHGHTFRFEATITMKDGRRFTVANTGNNLVSSAAFRAFFSFDVDVDCKSDLEGTYEATTKAWCGLTGPTILSKWIAVEPGIYEVVHPDYPNHVVDGDFSFGAYLACHGTGPGQPIGDDLRIKDVCYQIAPIGTTAWGDVFWYNHVETDGPILIIDWENDYGEGGVSTIVRTDGTNWPPLVRG